MLACRADRRAAPKEDDPVGTDRKRVRAAVAARDRGQGRLRAVTVAIGAASVLAGGGVAYALPGAADAQSASSSASHSQAAHGTSGSSGGSSGSGTSGSAASGSGSSSGKSSSGKSDSGLRSSAAPSSSSGSGQVTSGAS
jgi:hypothetical protein